MQCTKGVTIQLDFGTCPSLHFWILYASCNSGCLSLIIELCVSLQSLKICCKTLSSSQMWHVPPTGNCLVMMIVHDMQVAMTQTNGCRQAPRLVLLCLQGGESPTLHGRREAKHPWMECQQWYWRWASSMRQRKNYWQRGVNGLTCQQLKYVTTEQIMLDGPMRLALAPNAPSV